MRMSMTESEALKVLEDFQRLLTQYRHISAELTEANGLAIKALEFQKKISKMGKCYVIPENGTWEINGVDIIGILKEYETLKEKNCKYWNAEHGDCALSYEEIKTDMINEFVEQSTFEISESIIWGMIAEHDMYADDIGDLSEKIFDYVCDSIKKVASEMKNIDVCE